ncbi:MAG: DNA polymerase IV [Lachnospiraceae bacterium]|nr:DNA polymerase IV [Lachnospiraceae bacterium]
MDRVIFHVDVNSAFLSWTSVKRLQEGKSDLREIPAIIGGDPDKRTSVVLAKSLPAKAYKIRTGEPVSSAAKKCPGLVIAPPDFVTYRASSEKFISICRSYAPVVEQVSIDECFCDFSGTSRIYPDKLALANEIRLKIKNELGFTVNIGISENRLLAKMASDFEKPDKIHTLYKKEIPMKMWPLPVSELLFVGKATADKLEKNKIRTIGDLAQTDRATLVRLFGVKEADSLLLRANGQDDSPVMVHPEEAKGYSLVNTFEEDIRDRETAHAILLDEVNMLAYRMRKDGYYAGCAGVRMRSGNYSVRVNKSHQKKLDEVTDSTSFLYRTVTDLFDEMWDGHTGLRLLGIFFTQITKEKTVQLSLFSDGHLEKEEQADRAMDALRRKFGTEAVHLGFPSGKSRQKQTADTHTISKEDLENASSSHK